MATVGDPRADLGYLLSFWPERGIEGIEGSSATHPLAQLVTAGAGFPTRDELVATWEQGTGRTAGDTDLVRHAGDLEARGAARGVVPPAPRRHTDDPFFATPRARRARPCWRMLGRRAVAELRALVVDWGGVLTEPLEGAMPCLGRGGRCRLRPATSR